MQCGSNLFLQLSLATIIEDHITQIFASLQLFEIFCKYMSTIKPWEKKKWHATWLVVMKEMSPLEIWRLHRNDYSHILVGFIHKIVRLSPSSPWTIKAMNVITITNSNARIITWGCLSPKQHIIKYKSWWDPTCTSRTRENFTFVF